MGKHAFRLIVGITGATGTILGVRLLQVLKDANIETHLVLSNWGARTLVHETSYSVRQVQELASRHYGSLDQGAPVSSGSFITDGMVVCPCSVRSLAAIAQQPEALLGAMQSERQREVLVRLQTFMSVLEGYADVVLDRIGERLIPSYGQIHEAMKRHRLVRGEADRFIEGLLGLRLEREHYERGEAFCRGVIERAGIDGLNRLWERPSMIPTANELRAAGLWLARIELDD